MSFTEKIDVLDLLIEVLQEHEQQLDVQVARIEKVADRLTLKEYLKEKGR